MTHERHRKRREHLERTRRVFGVEAGRKALVHAYYLSLLHSSQKTHITLPSRANEVLSKVKRLAA